MRNFALTFVIVLTMTGCSTIKSVKSLVDPTVNPNNTEFIGEFSLNSLNEPGNSIENIDLSNKRIEAVNTTILALQALIKQNKSVKPEKQQNNVYQKILDAQKTSREYLQLAIKYDAGKEEVSANNALQSLNKATSLYKNTGVYAESELKLALLYLVNNKTALWQYQTLGEHIFPDYLKWGDAVHGNENKNKIRRKLNSLVFWSKMKVQNPDNIVEHPNSLVFSGGGAKGTAYAGILKYLQEQGKLKNVTRFIGTSAGSIMCMFMSIGMHYEENMEPGSKHFWELIYEMFEEEDFIDFIENPILNKMVKEDNLSHLTGNWLDSISPIADSLRDQYALCDGSNLLRFFKKSLERFGVDGNITLNELYKKTGKHLILVSCSLSYRKIAYFDYKTAPDLPVVEAVRASMAIPFVFKPVKYNNDFFIDGGVVNNYPINYFDYYGIVHEVKPATLGFVLYSEKDMLRPKWRRIGDTADYTKAVLNIITTNTGTALFKKNVDRTVFIDCGKIDTMSFNMTVEQKKQLMQAGYDAIKKYYSKKQ